MSLAVTSRISPGNRAAKRFRVVFNCPRYTLLAPSCSRLMSISATISGTFTLPTTFLNTLPCPASIAPNCAGRGVAVQRRPFRQGPEDAVRHFGGCSLGIGEAEYGGRPRAGKQQANNALRQHMRLAGAGIGRHPGEAARIGGKPLLPRRPADGGARIGRHGFENWLSHRHRPRHCPRQRPIPPRVQDGRSRL